MLISLTGSKDPFHTLTVPSDPPDTNCVPCARIVIVIVIFILTVILILLLLTVIVMVMRVRTHLLIHVHAGYGSDMPPHTPVFTS